MRIPKSELDFTLLRELVSRSPSGKPPEDTVAWPMLKHSGTGHSDFFKIRAQVSGKQSTKDRIIHETTWIEGVRKKQSSASLASL
jgi:hypothetical protein